MTKTCKVRMYGPRMLSLLFPGAKHVEIVGVSYSGADDHATITLKGDGLPDSEFAHATTVHPRPETSFRAEHVKTQEAAE